MIPATPLLHFCTSSSSSSSSSLPQILLKPYSFSGSLPEQINGAYTGIKKFGFLRTAGM
jgi:hypothetical protein